MISANRPLNDESMGSWLALAKPVGPITSNQPALSMPFQRWFKFKEAFAPSFVAKILRRLPIQPRNCLDPFGGSGTTALVCQFLGIESTTIEVNPLVADVAQAKLTHYDNDELCNSMQAVLRAARNWSKADFEKGFVGAPKTFVEPGEEGRWIFNRDVAKVILTLRSAIESLKRRDHSRFFRVMLASRLVEVSNILVNGKGRRYRRNWRNRDVTPEDLLAAFEKSCSAAMDDIKMFGSRPRSKFTVLRGDARKHTAKYPKVDFILTSPPYPNSFDYTDIYNVELWALGYLKSGEDNRILRKETLRSHVQIKHPEEPADLLSPTLTETYRRLAGRRKNLWNRNIPEMVCHYFEDMHDVLAGCKAVLKKDGHAVLAVGDSRYDGVVIDVPKILSEIAAQVGFKIVRTEAVRTMRASAQQGGRYVLKESLVWLNL